MSPNSILWQILDLARWAPSGDNTQPWRFEIVDDLQLVVHGFDTRDHCVYDLDGRPSQISLGALLETMSIAASAHGLGMQTQRRAHLPETTPTFDVQFIRREGIEPSPLLASITRRSVQRRPLSSRRLTAQEKHALEASVGPDHGVFWLEGFANRWRAARLMFQNAKLRLTMPEAYRVHRDIIEWGVQFSEDRVPDRALGADAVTLRLMRFVMADWQRVAFFNTYLAGTWAPRIQMDLIPGLACAAHFVIKARSRPSSVDDVVSAGRAVQRFWLTATHLGLLQQPEMTPLIFASYVRHHIPFTSVAELRADARRLEAATTSLLGGDIDDAVWMGRIGAGSAPTSRSTRLPVVDLLRPAAPASGNAPT